MKIVGVGCGPGMLTQKAIRVIEAAGAIYGSDRAIELARAHIPEGCQVSSIDDFKNLAVHAKGRRTEKRLFSQDKGQKEQMRRFIEAVRRKENEPIPFVETYSVTLATFKALESLKTGKSVSISD